MSASGRAPQLTTTKGPAWRSERSWSARAMRSLPVPLSPVMSTVVREVATLSTSSATRRMAGLWPKSIAAAGAMRARRRLFSATSWPFSMAFCASATSSSAANGF